MTYVSRAKQKYALRIFKDSHQTPPMNPSNPSTHYFLHVGFLGFTHCMYEQQIYHQTVRMQAYSSSRW